MSSNALAPRLAWKPGLRRGSSEARNRATKDRGRSSPSRATFVVCREHVVHGGIQRGLAPALQRVSIAMTAPSSKRDTSRLRLIDDEALVAVTGGLFSWEARPPMSSVSTGFGAWERSMKAKGLL